MSNHQQDELWRKLAQTYAEQYGKELQEQAAELEEQGVDLTTSEFTHKLQGKLQQPQKRLRRRKAWLAIAACLVLAILLPTMLESARDNSSSSNAPSVSDSASAPGSDRDGLDASAPEDPAAPSTDDAQSEEIVSPPTDVPSDLPLPAEPLPLPLVLPVNFTQAGVELDQGQTVYYLAESLGDDVVLTMQPLVENPDFSGFTQREINDQRVYTYQTLDYCLLTFVQDGVLYELTCRYSMQTLTGLTELII